MKAAFAASFLLLALSGALSATEPVAIKIRDLTSVETQTLANIMQRMGAQIPAGTARVNNVASVFVTASLPAFARPGTQLDVTVSSIGDAKSLEGGLLLLTPLYGADGQVYAAAQGPVAVGGFAAGGAGASKQMNHPTTGRIPAGGRVERSLAFDFNRLTPVSLLLREPDFSTAGEISDAINREFGHAVSSARDGRRRFWLESRTLPFPCTGAPEYSVSQPAPLSTGKTEVVGQTDVQAKDSPAKRLEIGDGANIDQLVSGLQNMGATARDVISILQAIKAAGALDADLEVI